jgi:hypothetical protein
MRLRLTDQAVAGYIAKYAAKAADCVGTLDQRIRSTGDLDQLNIRDRARRLIIECQRLDAANSVSWFGRTWTTMAVGSGSCP